jgi:hypothetical protein
MTQKITHFYYNPILLDIVMCCRFCVEFDLINSSAANGLQVAQGVGSDGVTYTSVRLESVSLPTGLMWHPRRADDVEDRFDFVLFLIITES